MVHRVRVLEWQILKIKTVSEFIALLQHVGGNFGLFVFLIVA